jgi:hypothetical protein
LSIILTDQGGKIWQTPIRYVAWWPASDYCLGSDRPDLVIDVLVEYDRTGRFSQNREKLEGLDKFLNVGRHVVKDTPVICLADSLYCRGGYDAEVVVLFVCPPGRAHSIMKGADQLLTGHLVRERQTSYEGRRRIVFCEADAFGNISADIYERERWLRIPAHLRPAPPAPRRASREMWQLPELPPPSSLARLTDRYHDAPCRDSDELTVIPWEHPAIVYANSNEDKNKEGGRIPARAQRIL